MRLCVICERSTERENVCPVCGVPLCGYAGCSWNHYDECHKPALADTED